MLEIGFDFLKQMKRGGGTTHLFVELKEFAFR